LKDVVLIEKKSSGDLNSDKFIGLAKGEYKSMHGEKGGVS